MKIKCLLLPAILFLTSCVSPKKFTGFVEPVIRSEQPAEQLDPGQVFSFDYSQLESLPAQVVSTKVRSLFVPLILVYVWNSTIRCDVESRIVADQFRVSFLKHAQSLGLFEKLSGKKLEIRLDSIPDSFTYVDKGHAVVFYMRYLEAIYPEEEQLRITYTLKDHGDTLKSGQLTAANYHKPLRNNAMLPKKFTRTFVAQYKKNIDLQALDIVKSLMTEL
jgi:hypothetical protein